MKLYVSDSCTTQDCFTQFLENDPELLEALASDEVGDDVNPESNNPLSVLLSVPSIFISVAASKGSRRPALAIARGVTRRDGVLPTISTANALFRYSTAIYKFN